MDGEAKMNTNGRVRPEEPNVATSFSGLTHDVIELAELQAKLFALDIKSTTQKARMSLIMSVVGVCLLLGTIPVALMAIGEFFIGQFGWPRAAGYALAALLGIAASGGILAAGWLRLRTGLSAMQRSGEELSRNIAWLKSSFRNRAEGAPEIENPSAEGEARRQR